MKKIIYMFLASILTYTGVVAAIESNTNHIESINIDPHWDSQTVDLVIAISGKVFEIKNTSFENLAELNVKSGDQVEVISESVDYSKYGYSNFELFFVSSGVKMNANGMSTPGFITQYSNLNLSLKHVFNFNEQEGSFTTEGDQHWIVDKKEPITLKNGEEIYIQSEKSTSEVMGASLYDVISSSGEKIGQVFGDSSRWDVQDDWEPELKVRVFTAVRSSYYWDGKIFYSNDLYNTLTGDKVELPAYRSFPVDDGDRIVLLDYQVIQTFCGEGWPCERWSATLYNVDKKVMLWWGGDHVFGVIKSEYPFSPLEILPWHVSQKPR